MSDDTWTSLRHWGRLYRQSTFGARMFARRLRESLDEGNSVAETARAAQVAPETVKKYAALYADA